MHCCNVYFKIDNYLFYNTLRSPALNSPMVEYMRDPSKDHFKPIGNFMVLQHEQNRMDQFNLIQPDYKDMFDLGTNDLPGLNLVMDLNGVFYEFSSCPTEDPESTRHTRSLTQISNVERGLISLDSFISVQGLGWEPANILKGFFKTQLLLNPEFKNPDTAVEIMDKHMETIKEKVAKFKYVSIESLIARTFLDRNRDLEFESIDDIEPGSVLESEIFTTMKSEGLNVILSDNLDKVTHLNKVYISSDGKELIYTGDMGFLSRRNVRLNGGIHIGYYNDQVLPNTIIMAGVKLS